VQFRFIQAGLLLVLSACGNSAQTNAKAPDQSGRPFTTTEVMRFDSPWAMDFLPGNGVPLTSAALVTERGGKLWLVNVANGQRQEVAGVPAVTVAGQGGLGDVVASPDFAGNQRIYLSYVEPGPNRSSGAVIGYARLIMGQGQPRLDGFKVIWRQAPKVTGEGHFSHRIAFASDGSLFISSGERQKFDPAQDPNVDLGKIIHMTPEGQRIGGHHYTMGHRNILGLSFAPDGRLWETEMGPRGGDELNLIVQGRNYGWPRVSYGTHYDGRDVPDDHKVKGFEEPKVWWNPSISPAGLLIYSGNLFPAWTGDALIPALSGESLIRIDINSDAAKKADQWSMGARIRAVDQGPRGEVYLLEDGPNARLLRLEPAAQRRR
jgi:aldose sugar dehydrogenase